MRKTVLAVITAIIMVTGTAPVQANRLGDRYTALYHATAKKLGKDAPGRNIRRHGVRTPKGHVRPARDRELARSIRTFRRWLAPPAPPVMAGDGISANPAKAGGAYAIPRGIVMCESGGDYAAVNYHNPDRPAGAYQIITSTWKGAGGSTATADQASPAEQDRVAARIWAGGNGRGQWEC